MPTEAHPTSKLAGTPISAMRLREGSAAGADGAPKVLDWVNRPSAEDELWYRSAHHCSRVEGTVEGIREGERYE